MWFEELKNNIEWFCNLPLPIVGISVGTAFAFLLIIFSKTSLGKKIYSKAVAKVESAVSLLKTYKEDADKKVASLKSEYEEKLQIVNAKNEKLEKLLIAVSENINNKKVKELVDTYCKESKEVIAIADVVDDAIIETKEQCVKETQSIIEEYKEKLQAEFDSKSKELEEQIAKYKELLNEVKEYGEVSEITKE